MFLASTRSGPPDGQVLATTNSRGFYLIDTEGKLLRQLPYGGGFVRWGVGGKRVLYGAGTIIRLVTHDPFRGPAEEAIKHVQSEFGINMRLGAPR